MSSGPTFDDIFAVMAAASLGDATARVPLADDVDTDKTEARFALALNILLDDLALRAAEAHDARFRGLLEAAPDAIVIVGAKRQIRLANAHAAKMFGQQREGLVGRKIDELLPPVDGYDCLMAGSRVELRGHRADGTTFPAELRVAPIVTLEGPLTTVAIRDVTERKQIELSLKRANDDLESFSYSVAHDLRTPLRAINGFSNLLLENYQETLDAEGRDWLGRITGATRKMGQLIDALLSLAKTTRAEMKVEPVDLSAVFRAAAAAATTAAPRDGVELVIAPGLVANADPQLVRVLADSLMANAWKFTARKPKAHIHFGGEERDGQRCFFVRDDGAGFDMAYARKLFLPFQRLHTEAEFSGTGVGLATVAGVVRRHGGRVWAEGRVGEGATFFFTLS
ncbi:MAG: PAS domain S-box protein [Myxococcaceae bacterium]|nr:PAS domain S-box protein [Myxococcaceae bacterium]